MCKKVSIKANSVRFNQKTGIGSIVIHGKLAVTQGVDDPVIEIWNAVQQKMQTAIQEFEGKKLIHFTPLFPKYDEEKDETVYELVPTRTTGLPVKEFLAQAKLTIEIFYKNLFITSFRQFLEDENGIFNYNGYSLYSRCIEKIIAEEDPKKRAYDASTTRMLLENFINFLGLPLPESKEARERQGMQATLKKLRENSSEDITKLHNLTELELMRLLTSQDAFDEFFDYAEEEEA